MLQTLLRKKWIAREDLSDVRDASRTIQVATLKDVAKSHLINAEAEPSGAKAQISRTLRGTAEAVPFQKKTEGAPLEKAIHETAFLKLNANQQTIVDYLNVQPEKTATVEAIRALAVPRTTLQTLVKRGIVELRDEPAGFHMSGMKPRKLEFLFTPASESVARHH